MAKRDEQQQRKLELLSQLTLQRSQITRRRRRLASQLEVTKEEIKDKFNVPKRVKNSIRSSFSSSPAKWFIGSAVGGLIISKILFGKKKSPRVTSDSSLPAKVSKSLLASSLIYIGKPFLKSFLLKQGRTMLLRRFLSRHQAVESAEYPADPYG